MTSHIVVSALDPHRPATFSRTVIGVLRDELGFDGVVVSDALDMAGASAETGIPEAAVRALVAGVDLLCLGSGTSQETYDAVHAAVVAAVRSGRLPEGRVAEAAARVRALATTTAAADAAPRHPHRRALPRPCPTRPSCRRLPRRRRRRAPGWRRPARSPSCRWTAPPTSPSAASRGARPRSARRSTEAEVPAGARVAVVGRAVGAGHPASAVVERLRAAGHDVVLVECGWPRGGADIETFGGSPAVARALLALLRGEVGP